MIEIGRVRVNRHGMTKGRDQGPASWGILERGFVVRDIRKEVRVAYTVKSNVS